MKNQTNSSMNSTNITCPNCATEIDVQDIILLLITSYLHVNPSGTKYICREVIIFRCESIENFNFR